MINKVDAVSDVSSSFCADELGLHARKMILTRSIQAAAQDIAQSVGGGQTKAVSIFACWAVSKASAAIRWGSTCCFEWYTAACTCPSRTCDNARQPLF